MKCLTENSSAFQKAKRKQMLNEIDWFLTAIATTAFDKFNMTGEEVARFTNEVKYIAESLAEGYTPSKITSKRLPKNIISELQLIKRKEYGKNQRILKFAIHS